MSDIVVIVLVIVYIFAGMYFHLRAMNGRIDRERPAWSSDLLRPNLFTPEGETLRRDALWFYALGGIALMVLWALAA